MGQIVQRPKEVSLTKCQLSESEALQRVSYLLNHGVLPIADQDPEFRVVAVNGSSVDRHGPKIRHVLVAGAADGRINSGPIGRGVSIDDRWSIVHYLYANQLRGVHHGMCDAILVRHPPRGSQGRRRKTDHDACAGRLCK